MAKRVEGRSDRLLECAMSEFMEMGYQEASLRVIAAKADTTTGSIYTRFRDKEGLFRALVDSTVEELIQWMRDGNDSFADRPAGEQRETVFTYKPEIWEQLVDFIYAHWDVFRLLARCTDISCYEDMLKGMIDIEAAYTRRFLEATGNDAMASGRLTPMLLHMLSSAYYSGLFEIVHHDMKKDDAMSYVRQLRRFFTRGWADLLGL
ncbi:MAG: TetR/AcrR family transcriptional regulator [Clostridia bacterium]|nr:TetR/AcrR family transcriptional regulator [Clostridia bacterium]